ncbi:hypothetical protein ACFE04_010294 [Oxalis oulophora]
MGIKFDQHLTYDHQHGIKSIAKSLSATKAEGRPRPTKIQNSNLALGVGTGDPGKGAGSSDAGGTLVLDQNSPVSLDCQKSQEIRKSESKGKGEEGNSLSNLDIGLGPLGPPIFPIGCGGVIASQDPNTGGDDNIIGLVGLKRKSNSPIAQAISSRTRARNLKQAARDRGTEAYQNEVAAIITSTGYLNRELTMN